jgi:hypothetical protein
MKNLFSDRPKLHEYPTLTKIASILLQDMPPILYGSLLNTSMDLLNESVHESPDVVAIIKG